MEGEPPQEEDFSVIPLVERSTHKNWKARLSAYNEVISKAAKTASDTDPFFRPYLDGSLIKSWCLDANAVAQEKGIEAALAIVTNSGETSARLRPEVVPALVDKGVGNSRAGTKKKAVELCAMFVEVENTAEGVVADVLVGLNAKAPKTVAGAVACLKEITEAFGVPALGNVKPLLKALPKIFGHSDKNVRAEGQNLVIVLYTFLGPALQPALADLKPVQVTDLQKAFDARDAEGKGAGTGKPTRWTRKVQREREEAADAGDDGDAGGADDEPAAIDPMSLLDPVDVLKLFPADLMDRLMSSKWKDRLESLEECNKVLAVPANARISDSNVDAYGPLVQTLGTKCQKDANVNVVMEAAKLLEGLSKGLGKSFGRFRSVCMTGCLERLKERKAAVVEALGKALDAIFLTTTLQDIVEDVLTSCKSKNPQVKEGTLNFLHRSLKATLDAPGKDQVKPMAETLVAMLTDSAEPVRTAAAECLGTMMKILGERAFNPYIENVPEIQLAKVKDAFGRAEIKYKVGGPKKAPAKAPPGKAPAARAPAKKPAAPAGDDELLNDFAPPARAPPARFAKPAAKAPPADELLEDFSAPPKRAPPSRFAKPAAKPPPADDELLDDFSAPPAKAPPARFAKPKAPPADELLDDFSAPPAKPPPARFAKPAAKAPPADELLNDFSAPPAKAPPARFAKPGAAKPAAAGGSGPSSPTKAAPAKPPAKAAPAAGPSKPAAKAGGGGGAKALASAPTDPIKYRYSPEEAAARAEEMIPANYHTALADSAWKVRLEAADEMVKWVGEDGAADTLDSEVVMRFLSKTPGWGEKNFQVSGKLYQVMQIMAERSPNFGKPAASLIIGPLTDKLGDLKLKKPAGEALTAIAEKTSLAFVLTQSYEPMSKQKAPKAQADALTWIKTQIVEFGIAGIPLRELISFVKTALGSPNAMVRSSATQLLVQIKIGVGADISGFIEDLNPTLLGTINKEFDKVADQTAPEPTRTQADLKEVAAAPGKGGKGSDPLDDLIPRVDLDKLVNQTSVIADSRSDAWKVRKEAFDALSALLDVKSNQRLKPNMGEIATVLKKAMGDTNLAVKMQALSIISKIATGMGQPFEKYSRILVQAVASVCADQKATTRGAAINTLGAIADSCGSLDTMYHGLGASLESTNPALRAAVLGFVADRLEADPPTKSSDLTPLGAPVISCLEDRNGDVRKQAAAVLPFVVASAGYDFVMDQTSRLKPASKATIVPLINNARGAAAEAAPAAATPAPAKSAPTPARGASLKAPASKVAPGTPRAAAPPAALPRPGGLGAGRSIAMKALSSAPSTRPGSSLSAASDDRPTGIRSRLAAPRAATPSPAPPSAPAGRTLPFITAEPQGRVSRLKRDATRWTLDAAARADMLEYLHQQMEAPVSVEIRSLLFSKDHKADEDFMAALATMAEFYDSQTSASFGLPDDELLGIQLANVDLALKYSALRLLSNNTQLANRCLEVISAVLETLTRTGERLSEVEVRLFVPALVIKLGDAKFSARLAVIFEGLDKIIPASQVVQLLSQYGVEDKSAGKTCKNESLQLIEKAYRKRGTVVRKDDKPFYEAIAKCINDQGTRQAALTLMALLQLQGESRNLQAVVATMTTAAKDMLANRRATMAAAQGGVARAAGEPDALQRSISPRPGAKGIPTPGAKRISREMAGSGASSPGPYSRPASRGTPSRLGAPSSGTPTRSIPTPSGLPRTSAAPVSAAGATKRSLQPPGSRVAGLPQADGLNGAGTTRPSMQPLGLGRGPRAAPAMSEARLTIDAIRTPDISEATEALKAAASMIEEDDPDMVAEARALLEAVTYQLELAPPRTEDFADPVQLRRIKHLMRCVHIAFNKPALVDKFTLEPIERCFAGIRVYYALLEIHSENAGPKDTTSPTDELRDYISMVLSAIITTPPRELVYTMLFHSLVDLCQDMTPPEKRIASEIGVVLQCTYKRVRSVDVDLRNNKISAGALLAIIEDLLQVIPPVQWRRRPKYGLPHGDLPLRVVKTLLQRVIVYTKEINIGIYDLLQDQFGAEADMTTVYSYIFRISSGSDEAAAAAKAAPAPAPAPAAQPAPTPSPAQPAAAPAPTEQPSYTSRRRSNGEGERQRPMSTASSRMSVIDMQMQMPAKPPPREVSEAERLVRNVVTDTRDSETRLNELYAFMKSSPENEQEARTAISTTLNPAAQTFVWRALDRRSGDAEPRSPRSPMAASPARSPVKEYHSPPSHPLTTFAQPVPRNVSRPQSMVDDSMPVDDKLAALTAIFRNRPRTSTSGQNAPSAGSSSRSSPVRPLSDIEPRAPPVKESSPRPRSEIPPGMLESQ